MTDDYVRMNVSHDTLMHLMIQLIDNHDNIDEATVQRHIRWTKGTRLC